MPFPLALLVSSGLALESYTLSEARVVAELPGKPEMVAAGPSADIPQSVQGFSWRAEGSGVQVTIAYDKWKSAHFAPEIALDRLARQTYGQLNGFKIEPAELGGLVGSRMTIDSPQGATVAVWNVKSGSESWLITVRPTDGFLSDSTLEDLRDGMKIDAKPEPVGLYDSWGQAVMPEISSRPVPSPIQWNRAAMAGISFESPLALMPITENRRPSEMASLEGLQEWYGLAREVEIFVSTYTLKENLGVELPAWGETFRQMMDRDGLRGWDPKSEAFPVPGANTLLLTSLTSRDSQVWRVEVFLIARDRQAWAIQVRCRDTQEGRDAIARLRASLALR